MDASAAYAWRSGGTVSSESRDERASGELNARPLYGAVILWVHTFKARDEREMCRVRTELDRWFGADHRRVDGQFADILTRRGYG